MTDGGRPAESGPSDGRSPAGRSPTEGGPDAPGDPTRVTVMASGSGTNFQALLDRFNLGEDGSARIVRLVASRPDAGALERARAADVGTAVVEEDGPDGRALAAELEAAGSDLVVLAGWLRLVPGPVVRAYRGRMINIHPALLPAFGGEGMYGGRVHRAVLESGVRVTGVTVHFVDEDYDTGRIIAQWPVPVRDGDDPERLASRVLRVEHRLLPATVAALARGEVRRDADGRVRWSRPWFEGDRFVTESSPGG